MDLNKILGMVADAAKELAPAIVPGAEHLVSAGEALLKAFDDLKAANDGDAPADAEQAHRELHAKVMAHADSTLGRLEGKNT